VIRRLTLRNWRTYENLDLRLGPGTTFIVAPNGVGKTSLMEAASWVAFGAPRPNQRPGNAVRAGATSATASVELVLPDERILAVSRSLAKKGRVGLPAPDALLDGKRLTADQAAAEVQRAYGADLGFLARTSMPRQPLDLGDLSDLRLHDHLCRIFGVDKLLDAAAGLDQRIRIQEGLIREAREGAPASEAALAELRAVAAARRTAYEAAVTAHASARERADQAREADRDRSRMREWQGMAAALRASLAELARKAAPDVTLDPRQPESLPAKLEAALAAAQSQQEAARVRQATLAGRAAALEQHSVTLAAAHGDCPVCRRPLDEAAASAARSAHHDDLERIRVEAAELRRDEATAAARLARLAELTRQLRALPQPGPRPAAEGPDGAAEPIAELAAETERAFSALVSCRSDLDLAERDLREAREGDAAHTRLEDLYAAEAVLRASRAAITATTRELLDQTIEPLTAEVNARWQRLFPHRGRLRTASTGDVSREVNGEELPFTAFSTGERTGLSILLRLLVLEMATRADFCWFDEPLEHLDPEARRRVAEALARASMSGPLRQIVVTTYEEPLARRLAERHPDHVRLIYVRQGATAAAPSS
jgi:DNA repair exonuclease SbcCD ATPase subunit